MLPPMRRKAGKKRSTLSSGIVRSTRNQLYIPTHEIQTHRLLIVLVLSGGLFGCYVIARADETKTNGFLVFEIDRYTYNTEGHSGGSDIKQKFKVPLTEEFMSNFKGVPGQNSEGTGFCCAGGNLKTSEYSTGFTWWIHKTADNRWRINMWGKGVETINGIRMDSARPTVAQYLTIKHWEDLDMSYEFGYPGMKISFTVEYVPAKDIDAEGPIPAAPVRKADQTELFKGDDLKQYPLEINCIFQEG